MHLDITEGKFLTTDEVMAHDSRRINRKFPKVWKLWKFPHYIAYIYYGKHTKAGDISA